MFHKDEGGVRDLIEVQAKTFNLNALKTASNGFKNGLQWPQMASKWCGPKRVEIGSKWFKGASNFNTNFNQTTHRVWIIYSSALCKEEHAPQLPVSNWVLESPLFHHYPMP